MLFPVSELLIKVKRILVLKKTQINKKYSIKLIYWIMW